MTGNENNNTYLVIGNSLFDQKLEEKGCYMAFINSGAQIVQFCRIKNGKKFNDNTELEYFYNFIVY